MRPAAFLFIAAASSACAASTVSEPRTAKAEAQLELSLRGKVAGAPVSCLSTHRSGDMVIVDDNTILFRKNRNLVYRNDPPGGCPPLGRGTYALVTRTIGTGLCRGEIAHVVDVPAGITVGNCVLGDFVPYRTPGR